MLLELHGMRRIVRIPQSRAAVDALQGVLPLAVYQQAAPERITHRVLTEKNMLSPFTLTLASVTRYRVTPQNNLLPRLLRAAPPRPPLGPWPSPRPDVPRPGPLCLLLYAYPPGHLESRIIHTHVHTTSRNAQARTTEHKYMYNNVLSSSEDRAHTR